MDFHAEAMVKKRPLAQNAPAIYNECIMRSTRAVVYKNNLIHNLSVIQSFIKNGDTKICAAVKANGYGSGAVSMKGSSCAKAVSLLRFCF